MWTRYMKPVLPSWPQRCSVRVGLDAICQKSGTDALLNFHKEILAEHKNQLFDRKTKKLTED